MLPSQQPLREWLVREAEETCRRYGYRRLTTPTFEETELFTRTSGSGSDIVQKEMYTFKDRSDRSLTLRPEATAPSARAYVEHGLHREPQPVKTFTIGPMFRYAAPQKGRYREFWQLNVEALGSDDPAVDAELIQLFTELLRRLGIEDWTLELNSIGDRRCRPRYLAELEAWLDAHAGELDEEARGKRATSPLRVFDSKNPRVQEVLAGAPKIGDSLCDECLRHFNQVRRYLDAYGVAYVLVPTLVRGLDYYTRTTFEFAGGALGAQDSLCGGGRYDYLLEEIGGRPTPAVGWAAGIERALISLAEQGAERPPEAIEIFFAFEAPERREDVLPLIAALRRQGRAADTDYGGRSFKGQLTQARRSGAETTVIVKSAGFTIRRAGEGDREVETLESADL